MLHRELQSLPPDLHWFCDRWANYEGESSFDPTIKLESPLSHDVTLRREQAANCLVLYSYDDADEYQETLAKGIDAQLARCDDCIEEYYKAKQGLVEKLRNDYDEGAVAIVEGKFNSRDMQRIIQGLDNVTILLKKTEPAQRGRQKMPISLQMSLFESLCNDALLVQDGVLEKRFQEPFTLVQTNRKLAIKRFVPAATAFLFDSDDERRSWAVHVWSKYTVSPTKAEFDWAIRDQLFRSMLQVYQSVTDAAVLYRTWYGIGCIVAHLDNDLITHSLRAMDIDVFALALDHLKFDVPAFRYLIDTIQKLLEIAPKDFWDAMGAISPTTFIEQIFNNEQYDRFMEQSEASDVDEESALRDLLFWIKPFMSSLDTAHQAGVCRSLAFQLLDRLQADRFPSHASAECFRVGLATMTFTLSHVNEKGVMLSSTGRIIATEILEVICEHIGGIADISTLPIGHSTRDACLELSLRVVKLSLALECKATKTDQGLLKQIEDKELPAGYASHSSALWDSVVRNLDYGNVGLAQSALIGVNDLMGLEKFKVKTEDPHTKEKSTYNIKLGRLTHLVCQILERINEFSPRDLDTLYRNRESATALISSLFSADPNLYQAGVNLAKSISSESARREAIGHLLKTFLVTTLNASSWSVLRVTLGRTYASCSCMLKTSSDMLSVLCDSQDGLLRTLEFSNAEEIKAIHDFWQHQWEGVKMIYEMTEEWGRNKVDDPSTLKDFCRDTMQFSENLFDQYSLFTNALQSLDHIKKEVVYEEETEKGKSSRELLKYPATTMHVMVKWLRLRDLFLVDIAVKLTKKVLNRLTDLTTKVEEGTSKFLELLIVGGEGGRSVLTPQQKAELARALEANIGRSVTQPLLEDSDQSSDRSRESSTGAQVVKHKKKSLPIDLDAWRAKAHSPGLRPSGLKTEHVVHVSDEDEYGTSDMPDKEVLSLARKAELQKQQRDQLASFAKQTLPTHGKKPVEPTKQQLSSKAARSVTSDAERALFREKREKEREAKKKRDAANLAMIKKRAGAVQALGEGSALNGIGLMGKDHTPLGPSMMVSSGSEPESDEDLDEELFGSNTKPVKVSDAVKEYQVSRASQIKNGPVKKIKQVRSVKDMRARLAPDLKALHREILGWEFFHDGDFPPGSTRNDYSLVTNTFRTPQDYHSTFEPLLILEAWQGLLKSKEEGSFRAFEIKVATRMNVDNFLELATTISTAESKELGIGEADIILMSGVPNPTSDARQPHCFARVSKISRKKATAEVTYRANVGNGLVAYMVPNATLHCVKVSSITPLEREYGALAGLKYFDLCDEITKAKPSPLLEYSQKQLTPIVNNYQVNVAQAKAVKSTIDNDAFTLIQGPPGSGKTKTIVAIVGALLSENLDRAKAVTHPTVNHTQAHSSAKKLLVCAPSNAAVDELVMRFKQGVKTSAGTQQALSVIRLGRSDAINANVLDVTLEELVNAKLNVVSGRKASSTDDLGKLMSIHKATCEEFNALRGTVDTLKSEGKPVSPEQNRDLELLRRKKQQLSNQIDQARDSGDTAARDAEISRRKVQQEVLDGAQVICATLSGSGHEMFQSLNIEFETVIIDEAAQSIELSALIPLKYGCSKCILVGDPKQLPPTVLSREASRFQYEQSLFVRMQANHPTDVHLLDTQYRMHPEISLFPSNAFYDGKLLDGPGMIRQRTRPWHSSDILSPYRFFDVQGFHQNARGHSLINLAEIDVALKLYHRLTTDCRGYDFDGKIGIITPYKSQLRELRSRFAQKYGDSILTIVEFNTTDAFQGRESEVILFSCVRASVNQGIGFLSDIRRMNVGITRAKSSLWVLGNSQSLLRGEFWGRLIEDAKRRDRYSTGDLDALLRKPLLSIDTTAKTALPSTTPVPSASTVISREIDMPDAPSVPAAATSHQHSPGEERFLASGIPQAQNPTKTYGSSGGKNGFNDKWNCHLCGSFAHQTNCCDNNEAKEAAMLRCRRCGELGHFQKACSADRCLTCGAIGHGKEKCTSLEPLSNKERQRIARQELEHKAARDMEPELIRKKQVGDHDRKVPEVKPTSTTPPPEEKKRKREPSPPHTAPKGPKLANGANLPRRPSTHGCGHQDKQGKWNVSSSNSTPVNENRRPPNDPYNNKSSNGTFQKAPSGPHHKTINGPHQNTPIGFNSATSHGSIPSPKGPFLSPIRPGMAAQAHQQRWGQGRNPNLANPPPTAPAQTPSAEIPPPPPQDFPRAPRPPPPTGPRSNIIKLGEGGGGPNTSLPFRPPQPTPNMIRPPKKKKPVDPFIRRKAGQR